MSLPTYLAMFVALGILSEVIYQLLLEAGFGEQIGIFIGIVVGIIFLVWTKRAGVYKFNQDKDEEK